MGLYAVAAAEFMAEFYESLFAGGSVGEAVTAGRRRLFGRDGRPSPKGDMPLADWLVPVHYLRREVRFPQARTSRPAAAPPLGEMLDQISTAPSEAAEQDPLAAAGGAFVGRDDLFYQLETAVRLQRVVVLTGAGGTGKTELAKGFARWWRDTGGVDDPRLLLWHSFEPGIASFGLDGVITGIGLAVVGAGFARLDPPQRLEAVKRLLGLAEVEALLDARAEFADHVFEGPRVDGGRSRPVELGADLPHRQFERARVGSRGGRRRIASLDAFAHAVDAPRQFFKRARVDRGGRRRTLQRPDELS